MLKTYSSRFKYAPQQVDKGHASTQMENGDGQEQVNYSSLHDFCGMSRKKAFFLFSTGLPALQSLVIPCREFFFGS